jgi:hypothetical protein
MFRSSEDHHQGAFWSWLKSLVKIWVFKCGYAAAYVHSFCTQNELTYAEQFRQQQPRSLDHDNCSTIFWKFLHIYRDSVTVTDTMTHDTTRLIECVTTTTTSSARTICTRHIHVIWENMRNWEAICLLATASLFLAMTLKCTVNITEFQTFLQDYLN